MVLDNGNDNDDDDDVGIPTADCWIIRQSKQEQQQSSIVIVAYDQFNAVNQQVEFFKINKKINFIVLFCFAII
jgi:hypothetical protein